MSADGSRVDQLRIPPQSIEAEQNVIGAMFIRAEALDEVADLIQPEDFYRQNHQQIFRAILELKEKQQPFDAVTVGEWFDSHGLSEQVEKGSYLIGLAQNTASAANARGYAKIVADKATLRRLIEAGTDITNDGFQPNGRETEEIVASAAAKVAHLTLRGSRGGGLRMARIGLKEAWDEIIARDAGTVEVGLTPPWQNVRKILPGLEDTDFMVIAGRPGMGKTVAGMEFADHAATMGRNVAIFSLEMSQKQLMVRMMARRARVDQTLMRMKGVLSQRDWAALDQAYRDIRDLPLAIDDTASLTIDGLKSRAARMHAKVKGGLGLVVIDYLQLMSGDGRRDDKRHDEVTKISRGMKLLSKDLGCPVIGLSQLNRSLETRTDKRPVMADLRESGAIEQDADVIAFVYRDDYYTKDASGAPGVAEFIIGKQRQGALGTAYLRHRLECSAFDDYHGPRPDYTQKKRGHKAETADGFDDDTPVSGRDRAAGDA